MDHNDDGVGTRPVCSIELLTTFFSVSKTETGGTVTSLISRDLIVVTTGGRARTRLDFPGGLRQLLRVQITEQQAVWCGRHMVESSHGR